MRRALLCLLALFFARSAWSSVAIDANVSKDQSAQAATITSPAFSTASANQLILAFIATDYLSGANTTVKSVAGASLTWVLVGRANGQSGTSEIWRTFAPAALSNVSVTATLSQKVAASLTVMSFAGVDSSGTNGSGAIGAVGIASAGSGAPAATLIATRSDSLVIGVGNDYDQAIPRTTAAGQSLVHQYLTPSGDTYWVQMQTAPSSLAGAAVSISDTAPVGDRYNLSICEIVAASSVGPQLSNISGAISPASSGSGAILTLAGASSGTTTADQSGNFLFSALANGAYTVTPSKTGYTFSPSSLPVTLNGSNATGVNFTAQLVTQTWTISGTISPVAGGSGASVNLSGTATATTIADASGNYAFGGLANGSYSVSPTSAGYTFTPASQAALVNGANLTGINFTAQSATHASALAIDANVSVDQSTFSSTVTSPPFATASSGELLLAFVTTDYLSGANTQVKSVTGGGLTWTPAARTNVQSGDAEVWKAVSSVPLSNASVTASLSQSVAASMTVLSFTNADTSGLNGANAIGVIKSASAPSGAPAATLVTTRNGSWVFAVGNDFDNAIPRTPAAGQSLVHQALNAAGDTYWVQMQNGPTPVSGTSVTIRDTAPTQDRYNLTALEVLPSLSGGGGTPAPPVVTVISPAPNAIVSSRTTVAATASSAGYAVTGVQFMLDGTNLGSQVATAPYSITWDTSTVSAGTHTLTAIARNSAGLSATASSIIVTTDNSGNPAIAGSWSAPVNLPAVAVNLILLPNNKLLFYEDGVTPTVWDYAADTFTNVGTSADLFCSGHAVLADGRILVVGGYGGSGNSIGISSAEIFDPAANTWTPVPKMTYKRWYPTATTLSDGRVLVTAGWQTSEHSNAGIPELFDPSTNRWTALNAANNPFETYPFIFQLADGRVIHVGGSEYATNTDILDLNTQTWSVVDSRIVDGGSATMYLPGKLMKAGSASDSQNSGPSSNTTFVLDTTQPAPAWRQTPSLAFPRSFLNLTALPDGNVLAMGGETDKNGGNIANAVYAAESWSPKTETWTTLSAMRTPREYHSTSLLLPDGRVVVSGMGADFGNVQNETNAEFFSPPYLFKGARPTITQAPKQVQYGSSFFVATHDGASIASAVLIRTGAVTHFFDQNTRYVPVSFQQAGGGLTITAPLNGYLAPPGYYMLFIVNSNGVPSVAPFVQLTN